MKRRILMVAYACGPEGTGEHWLGWGWAREASSLGEVSLITTPKFRDSLSSQAKTLGIQCHFVSPSGPEGWQKITLAKGRLASGETVACSHSL